MSARRFQCAKIQLAHINANASVDSSEMASSAMIWMSAAIASTVVTNNQFAQTMMAITSALVKRVILAMGIDVGVVKMKMNA